MAGDLPYMNNGEDIMKRFFVKNILQGPYGKYFGRLLCLCLLLQMSSCISRVIDRYNEDEIVNIMMDAHTLGLIYNRQDEKTDSLKEAYFQVLENRYGLNQAEFQELVQELIMEPDQYDRIYKRLNTKIEAFERQIRTAD